MHALCAWVCVGVCGCGLFVTKSDTCNFDADARVRISKNMLTETPLAKPGLKEPDQWQVELFSPAGKD